jgi:hypothetical protein
MQGDLLRVEEDIGYRVFEVRMHQFGKPNNPVFNPVYVHTIPKNWTGHVESEKLPWDE